MLQARANRVVFEYISIVRRSACWAPAVILPLLARVLAVDLCLLGYPRGVDGETHESASSRMIIL